MAISVTPDVCRVRSRSPAPVAFRPDHSALTLGPATQHRPGTEESTIYWGAYQAAPKSASHSG